MKSQPLRYVWSLQDHLRFNANPTLDTVTEVIARIQPDFPELMLVPAVHSPNETVMKNHWRFLGVHPDLTVDSAENGIVNFDGSFESFTQALFFEISAQLENCNGYSCALIPFADSSAHLSFVHVLTNTMSARQLAHARMDIENDQQSLADLLKNRRKHAVRIAAHEIGHALGKRFYDSRSELYSDGFASLFLRHFYAEEFDGEDCVLDRTLKRVRFREVRRWEYPYPIMEDVLHAEYEARLVRGEIRNCRDLLGIAHDAVTSPLTQHRLILWQDITVHLDIFQERGVPNRIAVPFIVKKLGYHPSDAKFFYDIMGWETNNSRDSNPLPSFKKYKRIDDVGGQLTGNIMGMLVSHCRLTLFADFMDWQRLALQSYWIYGIRDYPVLTEAAHRVWASSNNDPGEMRRKYNGIFNGTTVLLPRNRDELEKQFGDFGYVASAASKLRSHHFIEGLQKFSAELPKGKDQRLCRLWLDMYGHGFYGAKQKLMQMADKAEAKNNTSRMALAVRAR